MNLNWIMNSNADLTELKEAYALWNNSRANSMENWLALIADKVKWSSISDGAPGMEFSARCESKGDVARYMEQLGQTWEMLHYTVDEYIAQGDRVVVLCRCGWKHRVTGKPVETPKADIIRMKGGKIVEFFEFFDTARAFAATQ